MAVVNKNVEVVELLLSVGSDPNTLDSAGRCPLTNIIWEHARNLDGKCNIDPDVMSIIVLLIQSGKNGNTSQNIPSNICAQRRFRSVCAFLQSDLNHSNR